MHPPCFYLSPVAHPFAKPCASDHNGIEKEIIFFSSDDNEEYDDKDILLEMEPCMPFSTQMFPHHDGIFLQALCELEPSSMEMIHQKHILCLDDFSYGEPSTVISGEKPAISEQDLSGSLKDSTGLLPNVYHSSRYNQSKGHVFLTKDALVTVCTTSFQDPEDREFLVGPYPNEGDSVRDKVHTHGSKYTQFPILQFVLIKADDYEQGTHISLMIPCITKLITLSFTVYGMLTPFPFDRGKMFSSLSLPCPHAASLPISPRFQASLVHPSLPSSRALEGDYCSHVVPYCLWGVINKPMGSNDMHKLYCAHALAYHSEHLHLDPTWIWIAQESHVQFPTSSSHLIWKCNASRWV